MKSETEILEQLKPLLVEVLGVRPDEIHLTDQPTANRFLPALLPSRFGKGGGLGSLCATRPNHRRAVMAGRTGSRLSHPQET